jgi:quercetin dioxygenase-like cupin family protein
MPLIKDEKAKELAPGLTGYYTHGERMTLGLVDIEAGSSLALHKHPHEQITYVIEGQLDMMIGGEPVILTAGMSQVIPAETLHSAVAKTKVTLIDVFNPVREDYR